MSKLQRDSRTNRKSRCFLFQFLTEVNKASMFAGGMSGRIASWLGEITRPDGKRFFRRSTSFFTSSLLPFTSRFCASTQPQKEIFPSNFSLRFSALMLAASACIGCMTSTPASIRSGIMSIIAPQEWWNTLSPYFFACSINLRVPGSTNSLCLCCRKS